MGERRRSGDRSEKARAAPGSVDGTRSRRTLARGRSGPGSAVVTMWSWLPTMEEERARRPLPRAGGRRPPQGRGRECAARACAARRSPDPRPRHRRRALARPRPRDRPESVTVAVDVSEPMLERAGERFADQPVEMLYHDLAEPLHDLGRFDSVVSSLAIHHLEDERKRSLYAEIFTGLEPGGVFANFENVASPTARLHRRFFEAIGERSSGKTPRTGSSASRPSCAGSARSVSRTSTAIGSGSSWPC